MKKFLITGMLEEFFGLAKDNNNNIKFVLRDKEDPYEFIIETKNIDSELEQYSKGLFNVSNNEDGLVVVYNSGEIYNISQTKETE